MNTIMELNNCISRMERNNFILADKGISEILRVVACDDILTEELSEISQTFSYAREFERASISLTSSDMEVHSRLLLPERHRECFAFITCLFMEFDEGRRDFIQFIKEYYESQDTHESYMLFCREVLYAYRAAVEKILSPTHFKKVELPSDGAERFFASSKEMCSRDTGDVELFVEKLSQTKFKCAREDVEECMLVAEAFVNAARLKNARLTGLFGISLVHTLRVCKANEALIRELRLLLEEKGLGK